MFVERHMFVNILLGMCSITITILACTLTMSVLALHYLI